MRRAPYLAVLLIACSKKEAPPPDPAPAPKEAPTTLAAAVVTPIATPAPIAAPPQPASLQGKKILHVGDSMVGGNWGLTRALEAKLEPEGAKMIRHTKVSETLASMDKDPTLKDLMRTHEPDIVIVTLGTNDADVPHPEVYAKHVANIAQRIAPRECWWVGVPKESAVNKVIKENAGTCKFFDSSTLKLDRTKDGIHPTDKGGTEWADKFWVAFRSPATTASIDPKP